MLRRLTINEGGAIILFAIYLSKEEIILGNKAAPGFGATVSLNLTREGLRDQQKTRALFGLWSVDANSEWRDALGGRNVHNRGSAGKRGRGGSPPGSLLKERPAAPLRRRQFV